MNSKLHVVVIVCLSVVLAGCGASTRGSGNVKSENRPVSGFNAVELDGSGELNIQQTGTESLEIQGEDNILPLLTSDVNNGTLVLGTTPNASFTNTRPIVYTLTVKSLASLKLSGSGEITAAPFAADSLAVSVTGSGGIKLAKTTVSAAATFNVSGSGGIKVESVDSPATTTITLSGSGLVTISAITTDALSANISGSGDITVSGKATSQTLNLSSNGKYSAADLDSKQASAALSGSGDATLKVSDKLDVTISGSGSVTYTGDAALTKRIAGSGSVNKR